MAQDSKYLVADLSIPEEDVASSKYLMMQVIAHGKSVLENQFWKSLVDYKKTQMRVVKIYLSVEVEISFITG